MVSTAGTRLKLTTNGTFLSELYPRPATADAWKAVPLQHPAVARREVPKPDPDCLNLGCQIERTNASWVRSSLSDQEQRHNHRRYHDSGLVSIAALLPSLIPDAVLKMSSSVIQSSTDWLSAAGRAALSLGGFGAAPAASNSSNSSSVLLGSSSLSLTPAPGVAADLVGSLRQVVTVANSLLASLTGAGLPAAQPVPAGSVSTTTSSTNAAAGPAPAAVAAAAKPPVAAEKAKASK